MIKWARERPDERLLHGALPRHRRPAVDPLGYKILIEVIARGAIGVIGEVGYVFRERAEGESKVTWRLYPNTCAT